MIQNQIYVNRPTSHIKTNGASKTNGSSAGAITLISYPSTTQTARVCAVVPARNEAKTIGEVICETKKYLRDIIVVDNGSTDGTGEIARQNGAQVIHYSDQLGYGASQYAGQQEAIQQGFDYILQIDADGQHDPSYIPHLIQAALNEECDLVLGSRFLTSNYKRFSLARRSGIRFFSRLVSILGKTKVTDVTSGYKIYKASSLKLVKKPCDRHPAVEQVLRMAKTGMTIREIPVEMRERKNGKSHLSLGKFVMYPIRAVGLIITVMFVEFK